MIAVLTWRLAFNYLARDPHLEERVLIIGTGYTARMLAQQIGRQQDFAYRLVGFVDEGEKEVVRHQDVLGNANDIRRIVSDQHVDRMPRAVLGHLGPAKLTQLTKLLEQLIADLGTFP